MKIVGIGCNKTGTKTLRTMCEAWGLHHRSYDSDRIDVSPAYDLWAAGDLEALMAIVDEHDSLEDWPWMLLYREIDERFPDSKFVLTVRRDAETWYRSMCNMAVRIGPMVLFENAVYGSGMPQGNREGYVGAYVRHNAEVLTYFADRPDQLHIVCWETGEGVDTLPAFLGQDAIQIPKSNSSPDNVYDGENLWAAHAHRLVYQNFRRSDAWGYELKNRVRSLVRS